MTTLVVRGETGAAKPTSHISEDEATCLAAMPNKGSVNAKALATALRWGEPRVKKTLLLLEKGKLVRRGPGERKGSFVWEKIS